MVSFAWKNNNETRFQARRSLLASLTPLNGFGMTLDIEVVPAEFSVDANTTNIQCTGMYESGLEGYGKLSTHFAAPVAATVSALKPWCVTDHLSIASRYPGLPSDSTTFC